VLVPPVSLSKQSILKSLGRHRSVCGDLGLYRSHGGICDEESDHQLVQTIRNLGHVRNHDSRSERRVQFQEREEGLQWGSLLVPDPELGMELRGQGTRAGGSRLLLMEKSISGPPHVAPSCCEMGNCMCLDVVETAQYVDVF
jgi:hypothetical protein